MDKFFLGKDSILLAKVMRDHLNSWVDKPCDIRLEDLGKKVPSMMIQQLSGIEKTRTYINGSFIGSWKYAIYIRINAEDSASRLDAVATLNALADWLEKTDDTGNYVNLPQIDLDRVAVKSEMLTTPSISARYDDGTEEYQVLMELVYKNTNRR